MEYGFSAAMQEKDNKKAVKTIIMIEQLCSLM